jgi:hypothetical protein
VTCRTLREDDRWPTHVRMRAFLENVTKRQIPVTYQAPARAFQILSPHSIHRVAEARPTGARVLRLHPTCRPVRGRSGRSGCMVVSRRRAERRLRSLGRFTRQLTTRISFSSKLTRPLPGAAHSRDPSPITIVLVRTMSLHRCAVARAFAPRALGLSPSPCRGDTRDGISTETTRITKPVPCRWIEDGQEGNCAPALLGEA